mgnify:FL=1
MKNLEDQVFIVSGGATLIGQECARSLVENGAKVTIADIDEEGGNAIVNELPTESAMFVATDVTNDQSIDDCLTAAKTAWGRIDGLVNVACTYLDDGIDSTRETWMAALNVNLIGSAIFAQKVTPYLQEQGRGAIVNFGSISGKIAQPGRMLYSVSKAAILGMTRNQALALADVGIRVNSVSPGWTWSNVIRQFSGDDRAKADGVAADFHLIPRVVDASEVGDAVAFLCSDSASGITGTDIAVDGGYTAIAGEGKVDHVSRLMG